MDHRCHYCKRIMFLPGSAEWESNPHQRRTVDHLESENSPRRKTTKTVYACAQCNTVKGDTPLEVFEHWLDHGKNRIAQICSGHKRYRQFCHELLLLGFGLSDRQGRGFARKQT